MKLFRVVSAVVLLIGSSVFAEDHRFDRGRRGGADRELTQAAQDLVYAIEQEGLPRLAGRARDLQRSAEDLSRCMSDRFGRGCDHELQRVEMAHSDLQRVLHEVGLRSRRIADANDRVARVIERVREELRGGGGGGGGWGFAYINASPNPCYARGRQLCTAYLDWSLGTGRAGMVTVTSRNEGIERIFSCDGHGRGEAPWIVPGDSYIFRLYETNYCDLFSRGRPAATTHVEGGN